MLSEPLQSATSNSPVLSESPATEDYLTAVPDSSSTTTWSSSRVRRYCLAAVLAAWLLGLSTASFVCLYVSSSSCRDETLSLYLMVNGITSAVLGALLIIAVCSVPAELSDLAVNAEPGCTRRWLLFVCLKQLVGATDFAFFVVGNIVFFRSPAMSTNVCMKQESSFVYYTAVASLVSGYVGLFLPFSVMVYLSFQYRHYIFRPRTNDQEHPPTPSRRPATKRQIEACIGVMYESATSPVHECSICCEDYVDGAELLQLRCSPLHCFHKRCVMEWLQISDTCPLCKTRLATNTANHKHEETDETSIVVI